MILDVIKAVKAQALLITGNEPSSPSPTWSQQQWHEAFSFIFLETDSPMHMEHHDDLLFFVHSDQRPSGSPDPNTAPAGPKAILDKGPFSVRRRGQQLPSDWGLSGNLFSAFSWDKTVLLNCVLQAHYELTVITCR